MQMRMHAMRDTIKLVILSGAVALCGLVMFWLADAQAADATYGPKIYRTDGGDKMVVVSGGTLQVETGGTLQVDSGATFSSGAAVSGTDIDAGASGTAGTVDVYPSTAAKGKLAITAADSAGDTTTTITNASQAGARTYTIPDAGASASFVMTEGAQTVNGVKTLGSVPVLPVGGLTAGSTTLTEAELGVLDSVTPGTVAASSAVVVDANLDAGDFRNLDAVNVDAGASGTAGSVDIFPTTASMGKIAITAADSAGDTTTTITNASQAGARTYTIPDAGASASFVMTEGTTTVNGALTLTSAPAFPAAAFTVDSVTPSVIKWVDVTVDAATLDGAGTDVVLTGVAGDQYKVRDIILVGGGTNFAAGGDRLIDLTDGTTVWTQIANADIETAPTDSLKWGNTKVPLLAGTSNVKSTSGQDIRFVYSGGTTDHSGTGSIVFSVCLEKTD